MFIIGKLKSRESSCIFGLLHYRANFQSFFIRPIYVKHNSPSIFILAQWSAIGQTNIAHQCKPIADHWAQRIVCSVKNKRRFMFYIYRPNEKVQKSKIHEDSLDFDFPFINTELKKSFSFPKPILSHAHIKKKISRKLTSGPSRNDIIICLCSIR